MNCPSKIKLSSDSLKSLRALISKFELQPVENLILEEAVECVTIIRGEPDRQEKLGNSRYGGLPDLPAGAAWPQFSAEYYRPHAYLEFIMQINLTELPIGSPTGLPSQGMLYFFATFEGEGRVLFHPTNKGLIRATRPPADEIINEGMRDLKPHHLQFVIGVDVPNLCTPLGDKVEKAISNQAGNELHYMAMHARCATYPDDEGYWKEAAGQLFGSYYGVFEDYRDFAAIKRLGLKGISRDWKRTALPEHREAILAELEKWRLLWRIESDFEVGANFCDAGTFNVMIRQDDLERFDFSKVIVELASS